MPLPIRAVLSEAGQMGDDVLLTPFKNLFNIGGEEEVVEEEEAETEEVVLEEVDEEIEALFAESQGLIADSILVELDDEEV